MTNTTQQIDNRNFLDAKSPDWNGVLTDKPHMKVVHDIRKALKKELSAVPPCPAVEDLDELFTEAQKVVDKNWRQHVSPLFIRFRDGLKEKLAARTEEEKEEGEDLGELMELLSDEKSFEKLLSTTNLAPLESLRSLAPEAWYELILASSERQLAEITLMNTWLKGNTNLPETIGMTPEEIGLVLEIGSTFGKYFNTAFLKQMELADSEGGSSATPLGHIQGMSQLYEMNEDQESENFKIKPYKEVFKLETKKITEHFKRLSEKTAGLLATGKLPDTYKRLPHYLNVLGEVYGSSKKNPKKLKKRWEYLDKLSRELSEDGCPLTLISQNVPTVAGDANKVDFELRVGWKDKKAEIFEQSLKPFQQTAQEIANGYRPNLSKASVVPLPQANRLIFAFGPNVIWHAFAEARTSTIQLHHDEMTGYAADLKPNFDALFPEEEIDDDEYKEAAVASTALHELGHRMLPREDEAIAEKIGNSVESNVLEEFKAETSAYMILEKTLKEGGTGNIKINAHVAAKMTDLIGYIKDNSPETGSSTETYYHTGVAILKGLFEAGVLAEKDSHYMITDHQRFITVIADMGRKISKKYYIGTDTNPEAVILKVEAMRKDRSDPRVVRFLEAIKAAEAG